MCNLVATIGRLKAQSEASQSAPPTTFAGALFHKVQAMQPDQTNLPQQQTPPEGSVMSAVMKAIQGQQKKKAQELYGSNYTPPSL